MLGYSRFLWGRFCPNQKLASVLRCHIDAFTELGGVSEEVLYDRMKTVVGGSDEDGAVIDNPSLVALANHYGYQPRAGRPYRAKTKGKVERPYRYIRQDFFLARRFRNLDDLNAQFSAGLAEIANPRRHATTRKIAAEAFAEERLQTLPTIPYGAAITVERRISKDGMVSVGGNLYSVPDSTRRRTVEVPIVQDRSAEDPAWRARSSPRGACRRGGAASSEGDPYLRGRTADRLPSVLQGKNQSRLDPSHRQAPLRQRAVEIDPVPDRGPSKRPLAFYDAVAQRLTAETVR